MDSKKDSNRPSLEVLRDVILTEWHSKGAGTFHIRQFRREMEAHYQEAGYIVPDELSDPHRLVPTRRLLEARADLIRPVGLAAIEWQFVVGD